MARPHIDFFHSRQLPWADGQFPGSRAGAQSKILSQDPETGACSLLWRFPPGWDLPDAHILNTPEELFVLEGELTLGPRHLGPHTYVYLPRGTRTSRGHSAAGATVLAFYESAPEIVEAAAGDEPHEDVLCIDCFRLPWDRLHIDPGVRYLDMGRKNLRLAPDNGGRTYLLAGFPQARPPLGEHPLERHPYPEEAFMIAGDLALTHGVMHASAYFWRPAQVWHGGMVSQNGFLMLIRTPGANEAIVEWSEHRVPAVVRPEYRPILPAELGALAAAPVTRDGPY